MVLGPNSTIIEISKDARKQLRIIAAKNDLYMRDIANAGIYHLAQMSDTKHEKFMEIVKKWTVYQK